MSWLGAVAMTSVDVGRSDDELVRDRVVVADYEAHFSSRHHPQRTRQETAVLDVDDHGHCSRTERRGLRCSTVVGHGESDGGHTRPERDAGGDDQREIHGATARLTVLWRRALASPTIATMPVPIPATSGQSGGPASGTTIGTTDAGPTPASSMDGSRLGSADTARS